MGIINLLNNAFSIIIGSVLLMIIGICAGICYITKKFFNEYFK